MSQLPPYVLSIAGHDPSAGAGITADIKTFEQHGVYGLSVVSTITVQNDHSFIANYPVDLKLILEQVDVLLKSYTIPVVKIGLVNSFAELTQIVLHLKEKQPLIKIIWDPIIRSSSGFGFHDDLTINEALLRQFTLITPNTIEYNLFNESGIDLLKFACLLKGGHKKEKPGTDVLVLNGEYAEIEGVSFQGKTKHGTGCVLSAAIAANLANGLTIQEACINAKRYVEQFILSTDTNLGLHKSLQ